MTNTPYLLTSLWLILPYVLLCQGKISDKRLCGDPECKEPVSFGKTLLRYISDDPRILSFSPNLEVTVFSKSAGSRPDLWGAQIEKKRGYVPKSFVREFKVLKKKLAFVLPTEENEELRRNLRPNATEKENEDEDEEIHEEPQHVVSSELPMFTSPEDMEFDRVSQSIIPEPNHEAGAGLVSPSFAASDDSLKLSASSKTFFPSLLVSAEQEIPKDDDAFTVISGTTVYFDDDGGEKTRVDSKDTHTPTLENEDATKLVEPSIVDASEAVSVLLKNELSKLKDGLMEPTPVPPSDRILKTSSVPDNAESGYEASSEIKPTEVENESIMGYLTSLNSWFSIKEEEIGKEEKEEESDEMDEVIDDEDNIEEEEEDEDEEVEDVEKDLEDDGGDSEKDNKDVVKPAHLKDGNETALDTGIPSEELSTLRMKEGEPTQTVEIADSPADNVSGGEGFIESSTQDTTEDTGKEPDAGILVEELHFTAPLETVQVTESPIAEVTESPISEIPLEDDMEHHAPSKPKDNNEEESSKVKTREKRGTDEKSLEDKGTKVVPETEKGKKHIDEKITQDSSEDQTEAANLDSTAAEKVVVQDDVGPDAASDDKLRGKGPEEVVVEREITLQDIAAEKTKEMLDDVLTPVENGQVGIETSEEVLSKDEGDLPKQVKANAAPEEVGMIDVPKEDVDGEEEISHESHLEDLSKQDNFDAVLEAHMFEESALLTEGAGEKVSADNTKEEEKMEVEAEASEKVSDVELSEKAGNAEVLEKVSDVEASEKESEAEAVEKVSDVEASEKEGNAEILEKVSDVEASEKAGNAEVLEEASDVETSEKVSDAEAVNPTQAVEVSVEKEEEQNSKDQVEVKPEEDVAATEKPGDDSGSGGFFGWLGFSGSEPEKTDDSSVPVEAEPTAESLHVEETTELPADMYTEAPLSSQPEDVSAKNNVESDNVATSTPVLDVDDHTRPIFLGEKLSETPDLPVMSVAGIPSSVVDDSLQSSLFGSQASGKASELTCESGPESTCEDSEIGKTATSSGELTTEDEEASVYGIKWMEVVHRMMFDTLKSAQEDMASLPPGMTLYMIVTSITVLIFTLGYYVIQKMNREEPLLAQMNVLEKKLFVVSREAECMKEELAVSNEKLTKYEQCSELSEQEVEALKEELEEHKRGSDDLFSSVEKLQQQLNNQQGVINHMNDSISTKTQENELLLSELSFNQEKATTLEEEVKRLSESVAKLEEEKKRASKDLDEKSGILTELQEAKEMLDKDLSEKEQATKELSEKVSFLDQRVQELQESLSARDSEVLVLQDCLTQLKLSKDGEDPDTCKEKLKALTNVGKARADLKKVTEERDNLKEKLEGEEGARKLLEDHVRVIREEVEQLRKGHEEAEKEKHEALTRLEVLSNYFKEKETQLQKELGLQEAIVAIKDGDVSTTHNKIKALEAEVENQRAQVELLKKEVVDQERNLKGQISSLEKKAHENWVAARQAERKLEEAKQESSQLRNRLTMTDKVASNATADIVKPVPRHGGESNGEIPLSPVHHLDNPNLPLPGNSSLYREMTTSPPAFLPPGGLPPLPFGHLPPPPPPYLPAPLPPLGMDHRPPPLGRMSSPPPPLHHGYTPPPPDPRDFSPFERSYHPRMSPDRFAPSPPLPSDRSGRSDRGRYLPSPPPFERYPPPPLDYPPPSWDRDPAPHRSGFRPVPPAPGPRRDGVHRESKGPGSTSSAISPSHSTESLDRSSKRSGKV